jgi:hypothetical protein
MMEYEDLLRMVGIGVGAALTTITGYFLWAGFIELGWLLD